MYVCRSMLHSSPLLMCVCATYLSSIIMCARICRRSLPYYYMFGNMLHISILYCECRNNPHIFPLFLCIQEYAAFMPHISLYYYVCRNMPLIQYLLYYYVCRNMQHISPLLLFMQEYAAYLPSSPAGHHAGPC
jgi:hypothetical protein